MNPENTPSREELYWLRSSYRPGIKPDSDEVIESIIQKNLGERTPDGSLKLTTKGFKYMVGGC